MLFHRLCAGEEAVWRTEWNCSAKTRLGPSNSLQDKYIIFQTVEDGSKENGYFIDDDHFVPEKNEALALADYVELRESCVIGDDTIYHIDIPFSVKTELKVLMQAGFKNINVIHESYSKSFSGALIVAQK